MNQEELQILGTEGMVTVRDLRRELQRRLDATVAAMPQKLLITDEPADQTQELYLVLQQSVYDERTSVEKLCEIDHITRRK